VALADDSSDPLKGRQPAPTGDEKPPTNFNRDLLGRSLESPWWKPNADAPPERAWSGAAQPVRETVPAGIRDEDDDGGVWITTGTDAA
jgi:hypothetical protein